MKFVSFKSRGGDYLVIVQNVAWLRYPRERPDEGWDHRQRGDPGRWYYRGDGRRDLGGVASGNFRSLDLDFLTVGQRT